MLKKSGKEYSSIQLPDEPNRNSATITEDSNPNHVNNTTPANTNKNGAIDFELE